MSEKYTKVAAKDIRRSLATVLTNKQNQPTTNPFNADTCSQILKRRVKVCHSTILFSLNWENHQNKNPNIKNRDHLVGRPPSKGVSQPKVKSRESSWEGKRKNMKFKFSFVSVTLVVEQCNDLVPFCADLKNCLLTTWFASTIQNI